MMVFYARKIVEVGTYQELMANNGLYAEMFRSQAQWYSSS